MQCMNVVRLKMARHFVDCVLNRIVLITWFCLDNKFLFDRTDGENDWMMSCD